MKLRHTARHKLDTDSAQSLHVAYLKKSNKLSILACTGLILAGFVYTGPSERIFSMDYNSAVAHIKGQAEEETRNTSSRSLPRHETLGSSSRVTSDRDTQQQIDTDEPEEHVEVAAIEEESEPYQPVAVDTANRYAYGHCTWHVANLRYADGRPIPGDWGNATSWGANAERDGYVVNDTPEPGSIGWMRGGYGHVVYVVEVYEDSVFVKEMDGFRSNGIPMEKTYPISSFNGFIH